MTSRIRALDEARRRWQRQSHEFGDTLRAARHVAGLTQAAVGKAIGLSQSEVSRRELGRATHIQARALAVHGAAVGLKLAISMWPIGGAIRDAAQARYIARFLARVGRAWRVALEVPVQKAGDLRAADIMLTSGAHRIVVEVITRLSDLQSQIRAAQLKARDLDATRLILVVAGTHANRRVLADATPALVNSLELNSARVIAELTAGRDPGRDALIVLT
jgi:transcriptional regulator with XRE-family HTH domain